MSISPLAQALSARILAHLPDATVNIDDPDGAHLSATITSAQFVGLSRLQQHKLVYAALGDAFATTLHALQLTTHTPKP
jgi:stress-induced morphogen